jgi:hypothetical protein
MGVSEIAVVEASGQMGEARDRVTERHHSWIGEAQRGGPLPGFDRRVLESVQRALGQHALVTDAFDLQQFPIHLVAEIAQVGHMRHRLCDIEILRVVDRGLGP